METKLTTVGLLFLCYYSEGLECYQTRQEICLAAPPFLCLGSGAAQRFIVAVQALESMTQSLSVWVTWASVGYTQAGTNILERGILWTQFPERGIILKIVYEGSWFCYKSHFAPYQIRETCHKPMGSGWLIFSNACELTQTSFRHGFIDMSWSKNFIMLFWNFIFLISEDFIKSFAQSFIMILLILIACPIFKGSGASVGWGSE